MSAQWTHYALGMSTLVIFVLLNALWSSPGRPTVEDHPELTQQGKNKRQFYLRGQLSRSSANDDDEGEEVEKETEQRQPEAVLEQVSREPEPKAEEPRDNIFDGCYHVYLDIGSNIGVQVRKLYEPDLYSGALVIPRFDKYFGPNGERNTKDGHTCSFGFEPNPHHKQRLQDLQAAYRKCGWAVTFFTDSAVSNRYGTTQFFTDGEVSNMEWGGGIVASNNINKGGPVGFDVKLLDISDMIVNQLAKRKLPKGNFEGKPPSVVMKLDIEGSEIEVVPKLIVSGAMQYINVSTVEWHARLAGSHERAALSAKVEASFKALAIASNMYVEEDLDDESYYTSNKPLPIC